MANYAIILAAGDGKRLGCKTPKCFLRINKKPIYQYSLELFQIFSQIQQIILVVPKTYLSKIRDLNTKIKLVAGGKTRNESFENGLNTIKNLKSNDKIIVHDAARINLQPEDVLKILKSKQSFGTLCFVGLQNKSDLRLGKYNIQTPQFFTYGVYKQIKKKNNKGKDLFTYLNLKYTNKNFIISSNKEQNFKITYRDDLNKAN